MAITIDWLKTNVLPDESEMTVNSNHVTLTEELLELNSDIDKDILEKQLIHYKHLLVDNKTYSLEEYLRAIMYCTLVHSGMPKVKAYKATFPDRVKERKERGCSEATNNSSATAYHQGKLVSQILSLMALQIHTFFITEEYQALETLAELGRTGGSKESDFIKMQSSKAFLDALNQTKQRLQPQNGVNININQDMSTTQINVLQKIDSKLEEMAINQQQQLQNGTLNVKNLAEQKLFNKDSNE